MSDHGQATHERVRRPLQAELRRSPDHQHWPTADTHAGGRTALDRFRAYFWSDNARRTQTLLGLVWLLDGGLQFQGFMYSHGFSQLLASGAAGQHYAPDDLNDTHDYLGAPETDPPAPLDEVRAPDATA